jgi:Carboxypeptidase regulatory-like domain
VKNLFRTFAAFLGIALQSATQLCAQQLATLNVTVSDPSGSVISQARVSLRNLETDEKRTDFSSVTGVAVIPGLPAGKYQLMVESIQFSTYQGSLTLTVGQNASIPVTLGLKTVQQAVEVQETAQGVDPQKSVARTSTRFGTFFH